LHNNTIIQNTKYKNTNNTENTEIPTYKIQNTIYKIQKYNKYKNTKIQNTKIQNRKTILTQNTKYKQHIFIKKHIQNTQNTYIYISQKTKQKYIRN